MTVEWEKINYIQILDTAVKEVIPEQVQTAFGVFPDLMPETNISISIGIIGDVIGKFILSGEVAVFERISELIYGISLEGSMLESFVGELGNMLGGHCATYLAQLNIPVDITAPILLRDSKTIPHFKSATGIQAQLPHGKTFSFHLIRE